MRWSRWRGRFRRGAALVYYGPADWLVAHTSARGRRSFGFWNLVAAAVGTVFFGAAVFWVSVLSVVALVPNVTAETPVEGE